MPTRGPYEPDNLPRFFNAALFSMNAAFASMSSLFLASPRLRSNLTIDLSNKLFGPPRSHFATDAVIYWTATLLLASVLWMLHAMLWRTKALEVLLHSVAGFAALCSPVAVWFCANTENCWHLGTRFWVGSIEFPLALAFAFLFQSRRMDFGPLLGTLLLGAHFLLWFFVFGTIWAATYMGPSGPIVGFLASLAWGAHVEADAFRQYLNGTDLPILSA